MAMEHKTLEVANSAVDSTVEFWAQFGWELKSTQRVFNKNSHLERRGDSTYSITETVDFTQLVLERDKKRANYKEIVALEREYFTNSQRLTTIQEEWDEKVRKMDFRKQRTKWTVRLITAIIALLLLIECVVMQEFALIASIICCGVYELIFEAIYKSVARKKAKKNPDTPAGQLYQQKYQEFYTANEGPKAKRRMKEILRELEEYV